ncbi:MAG: alpha/beta fold hydrolase [Euryarchaeota archaeon]|nr:alpha/beta fold hydrolase [Euryarchaeota archaeon]
MILIHGLWSSGETWEAGEKALKTEGYHVLGFDSGEGIFTSLTYTPLRDQDGIRDTALNVVAPQIKEGISSAGYPDNRQIIIVGHSMGGLISRVLVDEEALDHTVERIITLGTPHQGSIWANEIIQFAGKKAATLLLQGALAAVGLGVPSLLLGVTIDGMISPWGGSLDDLAPTSDFILELGESTNSVPIWTIAGTQDLIVSVHSAIALGERTRLVSLGHTDLTGKFCGIFSDSCTIGQDAIDVVDEWLRLPEP